MCIIFKHVINCTRCVTPFFAISNNFKRVFKAKNCSSILLNFNTIITSYIILHNFVAYLLV